MKNKAHSLLMFFLLVSSLLSSQEVNKDLPSARISCGPWLQAVGENEFTVVWTTTVNSLSWVEVAPDDGTPFYAQERKKYYQSVFGRRPISTLHQIKVSGLKKGTKYRYRIFQQAVLSDEGNKRVVLGEVYGNDILKQKPFEVKTLDSDKSTCKFSVVNDIHGRSDVFGKLMENVSVLDNDFVIFNGDMLTQIESREAIEEGYMRVATEHFSRNLPIYAVRGNHEHRGSASYDFMSFFPSNNGLPYYTIKQGPAFIIFLECGEDKPDSDIRYYGMSLTDELRKEEATWLEKVVQSDEFKNSPIKIVVLHMPPVPDMPNGWHGIRELNRLIAPILSKAGIDVMLSGHNHQLQYFEKGTAGNNYPILVNSNNHRLDVDVSSEGIKISAIDVDGKIEKVYNIQ